jgi:hypothetical protein
MPLRGVAPVRARAAEITAAVSRIPAPPREAMATTHTLVLLPRPDATATPTLAATPAPATTITVAIRPEATAPTTMADAMVAEGSMRRRSADRMEPPTLRGFIVVEFGKNTPTTIVDNESDSHHVYPAGDSPSGSQHRPSAGSAALLERRPQPPSKPFEMKK